MKEYIYFIALTESCVDNYPKKCPLWKEEYCADDWYVDWMEDNCAKTCGYCSEYYCTIS